MKAKHLLFGVATYIPGINNFHVRDKGGTDSARYCYSIWLRHMVMAYKNGLNPYPKVIAELGPGNSLGTGLAALISGTEKYFAFDIVEHANTERNLCIFDEIINLFKNKVPIPESDEFKPKLDTYKFPSYIYKDEYLNKALEDDRIQQIRNSIKNPNTTNSIIQYQVPWYDSSILKKESVDMIYSQAVLEHIDNLKNTYHTMRLWLRTNGFISHQIDFRCHGMADEWNGHWCYSDSMWKLIRGKRPFLLNRETHSTHLKLLAEEGFKILCNQTIKSYSSIKRNKLAEKFKYISDDDLKISGAFIQAIKE